MFWPIGPRVEDPARMKELSDALAALVWDQETTPAALKVVFEQLSRLAHAELRYYYMRRKAAARRAGAFRLLAWLLGTIGVLVPVVQPLFTSLPSTFLNWGYLAIALAGAFVVADSVFSGTEAHSRYVTAQLRIESIFSKFALEWQALRIAYDSQPSSLAATALIERAIAYAGSFHESLGVETAEWKTTMDRVREQLSQQASSKSGAGTA